MQADVQADVQERGWVQVSVGVIDKQPPAGRSSVHRTAHSNQRPPRWAVKRQKEWRGHWMISVPLPAARFQGFAKALVAAGVPLPVGCISGVDVMAASCSEADDK